jgi:hypothetical protein
MIKIQYNREEALRYAEKWALDRNPKYYNFDGIGGDCTNFISQCIFAGAKVMNFTGNTGWYYNSLNDRAPAWSGVEELFRFLTENRGVGPRGNVVSKEEAIAGDIIQLENGGRFYHSLFIMSVNPVILVSAHTFDALNRPLFSYNYNSARFIHITGVYKDSY